MSARPRQAIRARLGDYDCSNPKCATYHELRRRPWDPPGLVQRLWRCSTCRHRLRLVRLVTPMSEETKARLRGHRYADDRLS